jgi:uncharacterized protein YgbK (DUF1537 family)
VLESLARSGIETVLFTEPPDADALARHPNARAVGIAGNSRTMTPAEMDAALPPAFERLKSLRPAFVHYKVCSTFDSSPTVGSIGRAIEIGQGVFQNQITPLVVGAPSLQRFCVFGNLFARSGLDSEVYRLDRHPTMSVHPVTPMAEADLRVHLSRQTDRPIGHVDFVQLARSPETSLERARSTPGSIVLFDTLTNDDLATIGRLMCDVQQREQKPLFVAGSSGIEYSLVAHWKTASILKQGDVLQSPPRSVEQILALSGSCSPVTDRQIAWAVDHGFAEVPLDTAKLVQAQSVDAEVARTIDQVAQVLAAGKSVAVHTSRGPADARIAATKQSMAGGLTSARLGGILGRILCGALQSRPIARVAVAGGDTSGFVARAAGIESLEFAAPFAPGAPLCVARSRNAEIDGVEFTFKGGQVGHDDFFGALVAGRSSA